MTKILSWNVNSLRIRLAELERIACEENPDVVCLQEVKAKKKIASCCRMRNKTVFSGMHPFPRCVDMDLGSLWYGMPVKRTLHRLYRMCRIWWMPFMPTAERIIWISMRQTIQLCSNGTLADKKLLRLRNRSSLIVE